MLVAASGSCGRFPDPLEVVLASIERSEQRWMQSRPVGYEMVLQRECECTLDMAGPARLYVHVTRSQRSIPAWTETTYRIEYVASGAPVGEEYARHFPNVQALFELARQAARQGAVVEITTDRELGYPTWLLIDADPIGADGGLGYRILELTVE
jgi:hypothetical protein